MNKETIYDIIGIGIGPFNLGLAALAASIEDLNCIFFDQSTEFNWHSGLLIDNTRLQVPFLADLVTLADPRSPFTYICFLKAMSRLIRFAIHENYYPTRKEYNAYCRWVVGQLNSLKFGERCEKILFDNSLNCYAIHLVNVFTYVDTVFHAKQIVVGIGTNPHVPDFIKRYLEDRKNSNIFHSSDYLFHKDSFKPYSKITIVGSGQSAAEIFHDILRSGISFESLNWFTRAARFYPMEFSKFSLEMTSPDYIEYFYSLLPTLKEKTLKSQNNLFKGINFSLINDIYDALYLRSLDENIQQVTLHTNCELINVSSISDNTIDLEFYHREKDQKFNSQTDILILATGYKNTTPDFIDPVKNLIQWYADGLYLVNQNYSIDRNNSIFVQNADLHSHGFNSADLGMGPYRNAIILNSILGCEYFKLEKNIVFQNFEPK